jgi:hypothetical protein
MFLNSLKEKIAITAALGILLTSQLTASSEIIPTEYIKAKGHHITGPKEFPLFKPLLKPGHKITGEVLAIVKSDGKGTAELIPQKSSLKLHELTHADYEKLWGECSFSEPTYEKITLASPDDGFFEIRLKFCKDENGTVQQTSKIEQYQIVQLYKGMTDWVYLGK